MRRTFLPPFLLQREGLRGLARLRVFDDPERRIRRGKAVDGLSFCSRGLERSGPEELQRPRQKV